MFVIKLIGKIIALPIIIVLGTIVTIASVCDKIGTFFLGLLNLAIGAAVLYCLIRQDWYMVKQGIIFFVGENVLYAIFGLAVGSINDLKQKLWGFVLG